MHGDHFDELETRARGHRDEQLFEQLRSCVANAKASSAYYAELLLDVDSNELSSRLALAALPVTRKSDLPQLQRSSPPFGGLTTRSLSSFRRVFASPGPVYEPERLGRDPWRMARALYAAGVRPGELIHNSFSYHLTPAGAMLEGGAHALQCPVFAAGVGQSELQVQAMAALQPVAYVGTPSFLKVILDKADDMSVDISSVIKALVSGEALPGSLREVFASRGVSVCQCYATADLGLIAYESAPHPGLIVDEQVILEIVRPGTGDPVAEGEVGEVLVTTLDDDYPLLRFATGDLSAQMAGVSPCGRTNQRIKGWMGRADQTTKVRGMFVHPAMVAQILKRCSGALRARLVVSSEDHQDMLTLECEVLDDAAADLVSDLTQSVREVTKLRAEVHLRKSGMLPNDGRVIVDERSYE